MPLPCFLPMGHWLNTLPSHCNPLTRSHPPLNSQMKWIILPGSHGHLITLCLLIQLQGQGQCNVTCGDSEWEAFPTGSLVCLNAWSAVGATVWGGDGTFRRCNLVEGGLWEIIALCYFLCSCLSVCLSVFMCVVEMWPASFFATCLPHHYGHLAFWNPEPNRPFLQSLLALVF